MQVCCCRNLADSQWMIVQVLYAVMSDEDAIASLAAATSNPAALHNEGVSTIDYACREVRADCKTQISLFGACLLSWRRCQSCKRHIRA